MTDRKAGVVAGVDAHTDAHHVAVLDLAGRLLATAEFPTTPSGYGELLAWIGSHGVVELVGVESSGSYAAALVRFLRARGLKLVDVNQPHRHARYRRGKSDPLDAELAARAALSGAASTIPKHTGGTVEAIRQLALTRASAVKARSAALHQVHDLIVTAPAPLRSTLAKRKTLRGKATLCRTLRPDKSRLQQPLEACKLALRSLARRIHDLDAEIEHLDRQLRPLVASATPQTSALLGVGTQHAAQLLVTAGQNIERLKSEAAFARICAAAPIPASSGRTTRHRLDHGGDRQANKTLHLIAVCRLRTCPRTRAYAERRTHDGLSRRDIIRCLKRYIAREIYHTLRADLATLNDLTL